MELLPYTTPLHGWGGKLLQNTAGLQEVVGSGTPLYTIAVHWALGTRTP